MSALCQKQTKCIATKGIASRLVCMYASMTDGPGALAIFDVDPAVAPSVGAVVASSDGVHNFKMVRLFTMEEVIGIRKKRIELQGSYSPPDK